MHSLDSAPRYSHHRVLNLPLRPARTVHLQGFHTTRAWRQDAPAVNGQQEPDSREDSTSSTTRREDEGDQHANSRSTATNDNVDSTSSRYAKENEKQRVRREKSSTVPEPDELYQALGEKKTRKRSKFSDFNSPPSLGEQPDRPPPKREPWQIQKETLKEKFPEGWRPRKRLSPDALAGIRALNAQFPDVYTTEALAKKFEVSAEAIRRILKSKWRPSAEEEEDRQERWFRRGKQVWERQAAFGVKPPKRWRREGIARDPGYHDRKEKAKQKNEEWENEEFRKYRRILEERKTSEGGGGQG